MILVPKFRIGLMFPMFPGNSEHHTPDEPQRIAR
jgi:hypothetical protein